MSVTKYGIVVPFDGTYLWVSRDSKSLEPEILLFDKIEDAFKEADIWGPFAKVQEYEVG